MKGWKEGTIKSVASIGSGRDYKHLKEGIVPVFGTGGYMTSVNDFLYEGETVCIGRKGTIDTPQYHSGKIWTVDTLFYTHSFENITPKLLFYIFQSIDWKKYNEATGVPSLSKKTIEQIIIRFPESEIEQNKIINILDKIDQSIEQTEQLIAKYKNIKLGLMHDLLTYGIDENGTIRNPETHSFVEKNKILLPEEWEVDMISKHILLLNGGTPSTSKPAFWNGNVPWLSVDDFNTGKRYVYDANKKITEDGLKYSSTRLLFVDDIIISARGTVGVIAQLGKEMAFNQSCYGIRNNSVKIYANDFIYFYLKFYFQSKGVIKTGSTFDTITKNTFDEIFICLPSKTEQQKIVSILEQKDNLIESEQTNLDKLQKLKQGLMADLLTGKIRVKTDIQ